MRKIESFALCDSIDERGALKKSPKIDGSIRSALLKTQGSLVDKVFGALGHKVLSVRSERMVLWVFGYGSLVWKAGFTYEERVVGYIKGYRRVFHQGNTDHRGTPENPGRCVTLEPKDGAICWGAAYRVSGHDTEQLVLSYLELREKEYDVRAYIDFYTVDSATQPALSGVLVFIGSQNRSNNKYYLGPAPLADMASQIAKAVGPSGPNYEYLFRLEEALCEIGCAEDELIELANEVRKLLGDTNGTLCYYS